MKEIWKDKKDYEGIYQVSNCGRVKSLNYNHTGKEKILKTGTYKSGYLYVVLYKNNKRKHFSIHRLVAEAFLEIPEELKQYIGTAYLQVNHKDENKQNNNVSNLEWCTAQYNNTYGTRIERVAEKNTNGKLSKPVLQYTLDGEFVREWESATQAEREGGFHQANICMCCKGKIKKYKGFIWRYL